MSYVDTLRTANAILLDRAGRTLDRAERDGPAAIRAMADATAGGDRLRRLALEPGVRAAIWALREAIEQARELLTLLRELNELGGSPDRLRSVSWTLRTSVATPLESIVPVVRRNSLEAMVPSVWDDGDAHTTYRDGFDGQEEAVEDAATAARAVARSLESMADGIEDFYLQLSLEVLGFAAAVASLAAGIITLAADGVGVLGVVGGFVAALVAGVTLRLTVEATRGTPVGDEVVSLRWPSAQFADF